MNNILTQGAEKLNILLTEPQLAAFRTYYEMLEARNSVMNLTSISGEKEVAELHFLDSLALFGAYNFKEKKLIDIGSGAGFPGLPLKIAEPSISLTLLDAQQKRVAFMGELCEQIGLADVVCLHARAEEAVASPEVREVFDAAVSRAVARLNVLCELCMPFVTVGGVFIAMKGTDSHDEISEAAQAIEILGGTLEKSWDYEIPGTDIIHRAVIIRKTADTAARYPRRFAKISKEPL